MSSPDRSTSETTTELRGAPTDRGPFSCDLSTERASPNQKEPPRSAGVSLVGAGRIELPTSSASRKRSPTELSARIDDCTAGGDAGNRTRVQGFADPCLTTRPRRRKRAAIAALRADDRDRTGDLNLGKVALYQLSYVRRIVDSTTTGVLT